MKQENIILDKSFVFAVRVVKLYKYLCIEEIIKLLATIVKSSRLINE